MRQSDRIYTALELLFLASRTAQYHWFDQESDIPMGAEQWAKEFCTIICKGPRRSGHTTALGKLVRKHLRTVALITTMPRDHGLTNTKQFIHLHPSKKTDWWGIDFRGINAAVVDTASYMHQEGMEPQNVYERFNPVVMDSIQRKVPFYFIFIQ